MLLQDLAVVPLSGSDDDSSSYQPSSDEEERLVPSSVDEVDLKTASSASVTQFPLMLPSSSSSCRPSHHSRPHHKTTLIEEMITKT